MADNAIQLKVDGQRVKRDLQDAAEKLSGAHGEVVLDFSAVRAIDPAALRALEALASSVDGNGPKIALRGVNVDVYKVLKLVKLAHRLSFRV